MSDGESEAVIELLVPVIQESSGKVIYGPILPLFEVVNIGNESEMRSSNSLLSDVVARSFEADFFRSNDR